MPKIVDHAAYRDELVARATQLFAEQGYAALGMREIAAQLGVSKSALYHYFPSKESLFASVCEAVTQADVAGLLTVNDSSASLDKRIALLVRYCAENEAWYMQTYLVLIEYVRGKSAREIGADAITQRMLQSIAAAIAGFLNIDEQRAMRILVFLNGLILQRFFDGGTTQFDEEARWFIEQIVSQQ